jgi:eukaryotic-like serine/threonine-protein kinase
MTLMPGARLGSYDIVAPLGAGGMGAIYRARDPRLDREVAIKVLSNELSHDATALARFEREAMSVAKLSHPNILSIFEFGRDDDTAFVVTELVQGDTLRERLAAGRLPARRAVAYALQIAKGMAAAHARGVVHRDLKPENVMITSDDHVKILDFGLAKSVERPQTELTRAGTVVTSAGTVLGTFGYMAPEQVRGLAVDHRADTFAFGAVLYEMLSGERAFTGETAADTMTAVLTKDPPDLDIASLAIPSGLERIVRRCLEKSPDRRFQSATDLAFALETLSTVSTSTAVATDAIAPVQHRRIAWLPWTIAAAGVLAAAWSLFMNRAGPAEARWDAFTRITEAAGEETAPTLSPDGNTVAYAIRVNGSWDIYSQRVGGRNATPIINDPDRDEGAPAFSPDGSLIAFHQSGATGSIFIAGATGESVRRLTDIGFDPAWSPDGTQIAFATEEIVEPASRQGDSALYVVDIGGGAPRKLLDADAVQPSWSPSGERIVYWRNYGGQRDIYTIAAGGGMPVPVTMDAPMDWSPVWSPDGRFVYFASDRGGVMNLWRIAVDQSSGRVLGSPEPVTAGVQASAALPRFSKDGSRLAFRSRIASINPVAIPFDPSTVRAGTPVLVDTQNTIRIPSDVSRDGRQIAYYSIGEPQEDIFIGSVDGPMRRLTDDAARDRGPMFTPDGRSVVFYSNRDGVWALWMIGVDGGGLRKITGPKGGAVYANVSPSGNTVVFVADSARQVFSAPLSAAESTATLLSGTETDGKFFGPTGWSPDGTRIAGPLMPYSGRPSGVGVYDVTARKTTMMSGDEAYAVKWLADNRRVVYFTKKGFELVVLDTITHQRTVVDVHLPGPSRDELFSISPDNRMIYYGAVRSDADIWIVERK